MAKINFTKVEQALNEALQKQFEQVILDISAMTDTEKLSAKVRDEVLLRLQTELKKLKARDAKLYGKLDLTPAEEAKFLQPGVALSPADWERLRALKEKIVNLKKEFFGQQSNLEQDAKDVETIREKQKEFRFHVNKKWFPVE